MSTLFANAGKCVSIRERTGFQYAFRQTELTLIRQFLPELPDLGLTCLQRQEKALLSGNGLNINMLIGKQSIPYLAASTGAA